jgi:hypothetical protein
LKQHALRRIAANRIDVALPAYACDVEQLWTERVFVAHRLGRGGGELRVQLLDCLGFGLSFEFEPGEYVLRALFDPQRKVGARTRRNVVSAAADPPSR